MARAGRSSKRTLTLGAEETELVERQAREQGIYEHGLIRGFVRYCLGLPISQREQRLIEQNRDSQGILTNR